MDFKSTVLNEVTFLDLIAIFCVVFLIVISSVRIFETKKYKKIAVIYYQGKIYNQFSLEKDQKIIINENIELEIVDKKIKFTKNDCPGQHCLKQGESSGKPLICVPNKVLVKFEDENDKIIISY